MAVRIVRQPNKIAVLGAPTSAAALAPGHERAPAALRAAGLLERLREAGYAVTDVGDDPAQLYQPDEESPRARNLRRVLAALEALKPRVEAAVKSGALPLILGGDCSIALATVAGLRRYYRSVSVAYMDRDADLNTPATTPSGCLDGMVVAHLTGRGAAELVRVWGESPLVREPDIVLFGVNRLDPAEEEFLQRSPIRRYLASDVQRMGAAAAAQEAVDRMHGASHEFVLHFDVDVVTSEDFHATNLPAVGGLRLEEARQALEIFVRQPHLAAFEVTAYNPERDPDGTQAKLVVDLVVSALLARKEALAAAAPAAAVAATDPSPAPVASALSLEGSPVEVAHPEAAVESHVSSPEGASLADAPDPEEREDATE